MSNEMRRMIYKLTFGRAVGGGVRRACSFKLCAGDKLRARAESLEKAKSFGGRQCNERGFSFRMRLPAACAIHQQMNDINKA